MEDSRTNSSHVANGHSYRMTETGNNSVVCTGNVVTGSTSDDTGTPRELRDNGAYSTQSSIEVYTSGGAEEEQGIIHRHQDISHGNNNENTQSTCCYRCQLEFRLRNFSFCHPHRDFFCTSQWRWPPIVFLLYRFIIAAYILAWLVITAVNFPKDLPYPWPVWLTNWSYLLLNCHLVLALLIAVINHNSDRGGLCCCELTRDNTSRNGHNDSSRANSGILADSGEVGGTGSSSEWTVDFDNLHDTLPWYIKLDWMLFAMASNICFIVTLVYFVALYPQLVNVVGAPPLVEDLHLHLANSLVILMEIAVTAIPIRLLHGLYPLIYGLIYIIFSAVYWAADHNNVLYPDVLDWNKPGLTVIVLLILALVIVPIIQLFIYGLYHLRLAIYRRVSGWNR